MQSISPDSGEPSTRPHGPSISMAARLIAIRADLLGLGRRLELDPARWTDAQDAFRLATRVADVTRLEALR